MKKKFIILASGTACFISIQSVHAASMSKTLGATCAESSAGVTATYYAHETTRWKVGSPTSIGYSVKADMLLNQEIQNLIKKFHYLPLWTKS